jgi:chitinase
MTITNDGAKVINWRLGIPFPNGESISSGSNCVYSFTNGLIQVSAASWNKTINPGASVSFEIIVVSTAPFTPSVSYLELDRESGEPLATSTPTKSPSPSPSPSSTGSPAPTATASPSPTQGPKPETTLPKNIVIGYWENWRDSLTLKLRDVASSWDVVNVSFLLTDSTNYYPVFDVATDVYPSSDRINEFKNDVKILQARGQKVVLSFGGEKGYGFNILNDTQRDVFLQRTISIIEEYGFDGFDVDIEQRILSVAEETSMSNPTKPLNKYLIYILRGLAEHFGEDFIIGMAPEHPYVQGGTITWGGWGSIYGGYLPVINNVRDILTYIHPQYYNNAISYSTFSGYSANSLVKLSQMLIDGFDVVGQGHFDGLRPDQVAICVLRAGASNGALTIPEYSSALQQMLTKYPDFRGIAIWSINEEERQSAGNPFLTAMRNVIYPS